MKILIVDDSTMDRKLLSHVLKNNGITHEILEAVDGEKGLEVLAENREDIGCVFLDYQMPNVNGIEFLETSQKIPELADIPVIMVTASSSEESRQAAYQANPNLAGYVTKPYKPEQVAAAFNSCLK